MTSIGFIGRPRAGKDTAAEYLIKRHGYTRVSIAEPIKEIGLAADPIIGWSPIEKEPIRLAEAVSRLGWERVKDTFPEVRRFLWAMSVDGVSRVLGEDIWTERAVKEIRALGSPAVVTDVRLEEEAQELRATGLVIVYLSREGFPEQDDRGGEHLGPDAADLHIHNRGSLEDFQIQVDTLARRLAEGQPV
ncbi:hypothetical protein ABZ353_10605 [Streptomyces niveus]|uniref:deoxynucleotide monophosphate kinase family protein n=1 Tax=Streptomyces niveus TaxID=193462 RepID=UPI00340DA316